MGVEIFIYVFFAVGLAVLAYYSYVNRCKWFKWDCPSPSPSTLLQSGLSPSPSPSPSPSTSTGPIILKNSSNTLQVLTPTTLNISIADGCSDFTTNGTQLCRYVTTYSFIDNNNGSLSSFAFVSGLIDSLHPSDRYIQSYEDLFGGNNNGDPSSISYSPTTGGVMNAKSITFNFPPGGVPPIIFS